MYFLYSFNVVAPIHLSSPRASIGFSMLDASIEPSAAPAPTTVCSSSMNRIILPSDLLTSLRTAFSLSSNSPLNFAPAIKEPKSSSTIILSFKLSGTSPLAILWARPSIMAVLPTPGSPINTGLFFVFLERICMVLLISSSLPITGSNLPLLASSVKSLPYFFNASYFSSGFWSVTLTPPRISTKAFNKSLFFMLKRLKTSAASQFSLIATKKCSTLMYSSSI